MNDWREAIPVAFGSDDGKVASHPLDKGRARDMVARVPDAGASQGQVVDAVIAHGLSKGWAAEQMDNVRKYISEHWPEAE